MTIIPQPLLHSPDSLLIQISLLTTGFSIICFALMWSIYWFAFNAFDKTWLSRAACTAMIAALALVQCLHWRWLQTGGAIFENHLYAALLFVAAPCYYLFSRELLQFNNRTSPLLLLHFVPLLLSFWLDGRVAIPLAFAIGSGYALWLCLILFRLRDQRQYFRLELASVAIFALEGLLILACGLSAPWIGEFWYLITYTNLIALMLGASVYLLVRFPDITQKTCEALEASYAASTLKNTDCDAHIQRLIHLLGEQKLYRHEDLSLAMLAEQLNLTSHQTSELVNTYFAMGFSRLIRQYRVEDAKVQLIHEPTASVLSIGMAVGFSSQSNFYTAFREFTGETPGQYRKRLGVKDPEIAKASA